MVLPTLPAPRPDTGAPPPLPGVRAPRRLRLRAAVWRLRFAVAALCVGTAAAITVHALRPPPPLTVPVVVLAGDVAAGSTLEPADVLVAAVPPGAAPQGALTRPDDVAGRVAAVDLGARLPLTPALLVDATLTGPPGTVVVAVRLDDPAMAALLAPGMHLDLVAARPEGGTGETVAHRALVRPSPPGGTRAGGLLGGATSPDDAPPVVVAVTPDEAVRIAEMSVSARIVAVVVP